MERNHPHAMKILEPYHGYRPPPRNTDQLCAALITAAVMLAVITYITNS